MKLNQEQKYLLKSVVIENSIKKDPKQIKMQRVIDNHYPVPEKFIFIESKINSPD